jgi:uncharacterized protein (TIRG00374 family)
VRQTLQLAAAILISVVCVLLSLVDITPRAMLHLPELQAALLRIPHALVAIRDALALANWLGFLVVCVLTIVAFWLRALRWRYFIQDPRSVSGAQLFSATMIGFMANNVLPFRLGEFVRPWALARSTKLSNGMLLATVVVERVIDMLTLLAIFGVALMLHPIAESSEAGRLVQIGARIMIGLSAALVILIVAAERNRGLALGLLHLAPAAARPRLGMLLGRFLEGFSLFRDPLRLTKVFAMSFVNFLMFAVTLTITGWSMHIDLPWYSGLVMLVVTAIGIMVPAAPGYVGTLNFACKVGLALFGVGVAAASAYSWFYFLSQWLPITAVGLYYLHREGLSLRSLGRAREDVT